MLATGNNLYAHLDFTPKGSVVAITPILDRNQHLKGRKYDMIKCVIAPLVSCSYELC